MTKKDFIVIAATLLSVKPVAGTPSSVRIASLHWQQTCRAFADMCEQQNPRFDRSRFLVACGMEES